MLETFLYCFLVFGLATLGMAAGLMLNGKKLSGSCGGVGPDGKLLADCLCAREGKELCDAKKMMLEVAAKREAAGL